MTDSPMARALELARGRRTHPNPSVGCVVVRAGEVVGEGYHTGPGSPHAEVHALAAAGSAARGATAYVTLEPCAHHGRTPPCADALIDAGVAAVVVAVEDPDPRVAGRGLARLRHAGVAVELLEASEAESVDPGYFHHRRTGRPLLVQKLAITLDGATAADDGSSRWITGPEARADGHRLRSEADAVLVGAGTLRADDPSLDVRLDGYDGPQPRPVILAGRRRLPDQSKLARRDALVVATEERPGWDTLVVAGELGIPDPVAAAEALGSAGLLTVLSEAGPTLAGGLWRAGVTTTAIFYVAPKVAGGGARRAFEGPAPTLDAFSEGTITETRTIGRDLRITFERA